MNQSSRIISAIALAAALTQCGPSTSNSSGTVGPAGGTLSLGGLTLVVPPGAVDRMVTISVTPIDDRPAGYSLDGSAFRFAPAGLRFASPITISLPAQRAGANAIYWSVEGDESRFVRLATSFENGNATANVSHFSVGFVGASSASSGVTCSVLRRRVVGPSMCVQDETIESNVSFRLVPVSPGEDPQGAITTDSAGIRELFSRSTDDFPYFTSNAAHTVYEAQAGANFGRAERSGSMISFSMNAARGGTIVPGCDAVPLIAVRCSGDTTLGGAPPPADVPSSDASDAADVLSDTGVNSDAAMDAGSDTGSDVISDAAMDTGSEAATDAGSDAADSASEAAVDAAVDSAMDSGMDSGMDASDSGADSAADAPTCTATCTPSNFRLIAPISTSTVTHQRPTLEWIAPAGASTVTVDLCADRACSTVLSSFSATGSSARPAAALAAGTVFWRIRIPGCSCTSATWQFDVGARSAAVDTYNGTVLDLNGDGYADLAMHGISSTPGQIGIYHGSALGLPATPSITINPPAGATAFGSFIASAGDLNGDGFADLVISAHLADSQLGRAYVFFGSPSGVSTTPSQTLIGTAANGIFGSSVSSAGDVNHDGYADLVVGASQTDPGGAAHIFHGSAAGVSTVSATIRRSLPGNIGRELGTASDFNGDRFADIAVAASAGLNTFWSVYHGSTTGISATEAVSVSGTTTNFGFLAAPGDINGDGYADLVVGSTESGAYGEVYVHLGSSIGVGASASRTLVPPAGSTDGGFGLSVHAIGDINGDGYADFSIDQGSGWGLARGIVHVYAGASTLGTTFLHTITAPEGNSARFGDSMTGADFNGDHFSDFVCESGGTAGLAARVYRGSATGLIVASPQRYSLPLASGWDANIAAR